MPKSRNRKEVSRKKSRYSSDSDSERDRRARRYREKSRAKRSRERDYEKERKKRRETSSSSSSSSSRSSLSSSTSSSDGKKSREDSKSSSKNNFDHISKFEIDLYKEQDKSKAIEEIEDNSFKAGTFQSKKSIIVDLKKDQILLPDTLTASAPAEEESLIHPDFLGDDQKKIDKWVRKLYLYRNS